MIRPQHPYHLLLFETPPSFNAVGHTGNRWAWTKVKKQWQESIEIVLMQAQLPRENFTFIQAEAQLTFTTNRRRDEGNYRVLLEKCLGDALVNGRWLPDDIPEHFLFDRISFAKGMQAMTEIVLR